MRVFGRMTMAVVVAVALAAPVAAQQPPAMDCTKMLTMITNEAGMRLDEASYAAKLKAEQIAQLCKDGKTVEGEKLAREVMASLGLK